MPSKHYHMKWQQRKALEDPVWYEARKKKRTELWRSRKQQAVEYLGNKCCKCKRKFPWFVYDVHHLDPDTKSKRIRGRATNSLFMLKWETVVKELNVCVLLCSNCHRVEHHG